MTELEVLMLILLIGPAVIVFFELTAATEKERTRWMVMLFLFALAFIGLVFAGAGHAAPATTDPRVCGAPPRDAAGKIARDRAALRAFKHLYPCPATGKSTGACPGWQIDHVIPLACGGCDTVGNMQWLTTQAKRTPKTGKDARERIIYCGPRT